MIPTLSDGKKVLPEGMPVGSEDGGLVLGTLLLRFDDGATFYTVKSSMPRLRSA